MRRLFLASLAAAFLSTPALAVPISPTDRGPFDNGAYPPAASGIVTIDVLNTTLGNYVTGEALTAALGSYVTQTALSSALAPYETTSHAASTYLPLSGGSITGALSVASSLNTQGALSAYGSIRVYNNSVSTENGAAVFLNSNSWLQLYYWGSQNIVQGFQASAFMEQLTTPASSSSSCLAGQFTDDANYHYVCVSSNTWKRSALSSF